MKLSVLIPVFQQDIRKLVGELHRQLMECDIEFEICCLDDFSDASIRNLNKRIVNEGHPEIKYEELPFNTGRSAIRNRLAEIASGEFLWFLDCDADATVNPQLVRNFLKQMRPGLLLSGGRVYQQEIPADQALYLHWLWGSRRELLDPARRMSDPVSHFLSNNFVIHSGDFKKVRFSTELTGYGYEDTFFAHELKEKGVEILHINNPVRHTGLEPAGEFLQKIRESLHNLIRLEQICIERSIAFPVRSKLARWYRLLQKPLFRPFSKLLAGVFFKPLGKSLLGSRPNLLLLDLYRITYLMKIS